MFIKTQWTFIATAGRHYQARSNDGINNTFLARISTCTKRLHPFKIEADRSRYHAAPHPTYLPHSCNTGTGIARCCQGRQHSPRRRGWSRVDRPNSRGCCSRCWSTQRARTGRRGWMVGHLRWYGTTSVLSSPCPLSPAISQEICCSGWVPTPVFLCRLTMAMVKKYKHRHWLLLCWLDFEKSNKYLSVHIYTNNAHPHTYTTCACLRMYVLLPSITISVHQTCKLK